MSTSVPIPYNDPVVERDQDTEDPKRRIIGTISRLWGRFIQTSILKRLDACAIRLKKVDLAGQNATIGPTVIALALLPGGFYRVNYNIRVQVPAGVASSYELIIGWLDGGVAQSFTTGVIAGNTTTTQSQRTFPIQIDQNSSITYAVNYTSNPAANMQFRVIISVESTD